MEPYKAKRNEYDNLNQEEEKSEKEIEKEKDEEAADKVTSAVAKGVGMYFGGSMGVEAVKLAEQTKAGQMVEKGVSKSIQQNPLLKKTARKLNDSGVVDAADQAMDMFGGMKGGGAGAAGAGAAKSSGSMPKAGNTKMPSNKAPSMNNNKTSSSSKLDTAKLNNNSSNKNNDLLKNLSGNFSGPNLLKIKIALAFGVFIFFTLLIFGGAAAQKDFYNLALTNQTTLASSNIGSKKCTADEISNKVIYVGDSRTTMLEDALKDTKPKEDFIGSVSAGYDWFSTTGISEIEKKISTDPSSIIVINFGINDINNVDNYINLYQNLFEKYPDVKFYIMSINPVDESITNQNGYYVTNQDIETFNSKIASTFPNQYINTYNDINNDFETTDGIHYSDITSKKIHDTLTTILSDTSDITCGSGTISNIEDSSLNGGNFSKLKSGESILSKIGQEKLDAWNENIKKDVDAAGIGSGQAVAIAAYDLVQGALNENFVIPYFWGGGHGSITLGINGSWGSGAAIKVSGNSAQPVGSIQPNGLDCSGFVSWALKNGGCSNFTPITAKDFKNLGYEINASNAVAGDIAASNTHVMIILNNTGSELIVAEAKGASTGIVFSKFSYSHFKKYKIVSMSNYYSKNCNG